MKTPIVCEVIVLGEPRPSPEPPGEAAAAQVQIVPVYPSKNLVLEAGRYRAVDHDK